MPMKYSNENNYSLSIAVWLMTDHYDSFPNPENKEAYSATELLKPTRMLVLSKRMATQEQAVDALPIDIAGFMPSRLGTAIHDSIEKAWHSDKLSYVLSALNYPKHVIENIRINPTEQELENKNIIPIYMEQREQRNFMNTIIHGKFDFIGNGFLEDFKTTGVYGYLQDSNTMQYQLQGSIYRWLNPKKVTQPYMKIQYIFTDWSKLQAMIQKEKGYPQTRNISKKIPLLSLEETESYIHNKIGAIQEALQQDESELPYCTPEELWMSKPIYKVYKTMDSKRSSGNFETYAEAEQKQKSMGTGFIKEFPGQVKRCIYCSGFDLCTQKDQYITNETLILP